MSPPPLPPRGASRSDAADALAAIAPLATRWIERLLAGQEPSLTLTQFVALRAIAREGVSTTELAQRAGVSGPAASQLLASLAGAGLIEREPVPGDRRRYVLAPSEEGRRAWRAAERLLRRRLSALLADIPGPEVDALARALPHVEAALSGSPPPRRPPPPPHPPRRR
jgi:DNA-binding MarR family transcriptional regulator